MRLPAEYQELEWIQSSGNCIIDTGYSPSGTYIKICTKFNYNTFGVYLGDTPFVFGHTQSNTCFLTRDAGNGCVNYGCGGNKATQTGGLYISQATDYEAEIVGTGGTQTININGRTYSDTYGGNISTGALPLFCRYANSRYEYFATDMKLYYFKIYTNETTLALDMIPCYRKSDGVAGMYDLVGNTFYTNSGSGTFIKGPSVNNKVKRVYIGTKLIRPKWEPNEKNILYMPLNNSIKDIISGSNANQYGTVTFTQLDSGIYVGNMNHYNYLYKQISCSGPMTAICRIKRTSGDCFVRAEVGGTGSNRKFYQIGTGVTEPNGGGYWRTYYNQYGGSINNPKNGWQCCALVCGSKGIYAYSNAQTAYYNATNNNFVRGNQTWYFIYATVTQQTSEYGTGSFSNFIIENSERTYEQIKDYYDSTKALYGINN